MFSNAAYLPYLSVLCCTDACKWRVMSDQRTMVSSPSRVWVWVGLWVTPDVGQPQVGCQRRSGGALPPPLLLASCSCHLIFMEIIIFILWFCFRSDQLVDPNSLHGGARGSTWSRLVEDALFNRQPPVRAEQVKGGTTSAVNSALKLPRCCKRDKSWEPHLMCG